MRILSLFRLLQVKAKSANLQIYTYFLTIIVTFRFKNEDDRNIRILPNATRTKYSIVFWKLQGEAVQCALLF